MNAREIEQLSEHQIQLFLKLDNLNLTPEEDPSDDPFRAIPINGSRFADQDLDLLILQLRGIREALPWLLAEEHYLSTGIQVRNTIPVSSINRVYLQSENPEVCFVFRKGDHFCHLDTYIRIADEKIPLSPKIIPFYGVLSINANLYLFSEDAARTISFFLNQESYRIHTEDLKPFYEQFLRPLMERYEVRLEGFPSPQSLEATIAEKTVYLQEAGEQLVMTPEIRYQTAEGESFSVMLDGGKRKYFSLGEAHQMRFANRNLPEEARLIDAFQQLHPRFHQIASTGFQLPLDLILWNNWFFKTFDRFRELGFEVMGLKELKKIRYNPHRPSIRMSGNSGTDWFDLQIEVSFGDQKVKLSAIRKAVINRQSFVELGDGSIGMLPEEWLQKYSKILSLGKVQEDNVRLSQFQINLIDDLYTEIDNHQSFEHLMEKMQRLRNFDSIREVPPHPELTAELRNYQKAGLNWLSFLDEIRWGGCLADDMGLGKTVQVLALLMNVSERTPEATHLVVVPKSLVFNWMHEIQKFCPNLRVHNHSGPDRFDRPEQLTPFDLIITTYGIARSDIELLRHIPFHYVVLDESQAIKNPTTQTAKAVKLLQSQNRLI
ncbi:MAG: SNF2-related protein, partial [Bacteroidota bacterium]